MSREKMKLSDYKIGDKVKVCVLGENKTATVLNASDDGVDVEIDNPTTLRYIESNAFIAYFSPKTRIEKVKIKNEYTIAKIEK